MKKLKSLRFKIPAVIITMIVVFTLILIIMVEKMTSASIKSIAYEGYNNTIFGYSELFDNWFTDELNKAIIYASNDDIVNFAQSRTEENRQACFNTLNRFNRLNEYCINIGLCDSNGNIILDSTDNNLIGQNIFSIHPSLRNKISGNQNGVFSDDISHSKITGNWCLVLLEKCFNPNNQLIGYLYVTLDWATLIKMHIEPLIIGKSGSIFAIDENLTITIHSKKDFINTKAPQEYLSFFNVGNGILNYTFNGEKRAASIKKMKSQNWVLGVSITEAELYESIKKLTISISTVSIISIIAISITIILYIGTITKPLKLLVGLAKEIASGDLRTTKQKIIRTDELGDFSNAFVAMRKTLVATIKKIEEISMNITMAAKELSEQNTDLAHRTESQAASIEQTSASMTQIMSNIKASTDASLNGSKIIQESKTSVEDTSSIIAETTKNIEEVHEASSKIKDITKIIEDIAFQTNILALNASVEAARAGEQGKGFAVVASEVRNLAQTTQTSVKSITDLIENVYEKIDKATGTARQSQEIFIEIQNKIDEAAQIMDNISNGAMEQQSGIDQIKIAVQGMDATTQKNAALVEESTASSEMLYSQSEELISAIHLFKLPDGSK